MTAYEEPTCSTRRRPVALFTERVVELERVDDLRRPPSENKVRELLRKAGLRPADVVRTKDTAARALQTADDQATLRTLPADSGLLGRPLVERVDRALSARRLQSVLELLR
jgi:arsenate reductase